MLCSGTAGIIMLVGPASRLDSVYIVGLHCGDSFDVDSTSARHTSAKKRDSTGRHRPQRIAETDDTGECDTIINY